MRGGTGSLAAALAAALVACGPVAEDPCALAAASAPWLAFSSRRAGTHDVWLSRADGSCQRPLTMAEGEDLFATWSGGEVAYTSDRGGAGPGIWIHDVATGYERRLDLGALYATAPAFSPDGSALAFEARVQGSLDTNIWVVPVAGGDALQLTDDAASDAGPAWSADGTTVYFVSARLGWFEIFSVPAAGGGATQVTSGSRILGKPAVSPDGSTLAWARPGASTASEVVVYDLATEAVQVVSDAGDSEPAFDPTGTRLAVRSLRYGNPEIAIVDLDGSNAVRATSDPAEDGAPAFAR